MIMIIIEEGVEEEESLVRIVVKIIIRLKIVGVIEIQQIDLRMLRMPRMPILITRNIILTILIKMPIKMLWDILRVVMIIIIRILILLEEYNFLRVIIVEE